MSGPGCDDCDGEGSIEIFTCGTYRCKCDGFSGGCSEFKPCHCQEESEPDYESMRDYPLDDQGKVEWEGSI